MTGMAARGVGVAAARAHSGFVGDLAFGAHRYRELRPPRWQFGSVIGLRTADVFRYRPPSRQTALTIYASPSGKLLAFLIWRRYA
jgi:hypothetical protein